MDLNSQQDVKPKHGDGSNEKGESARDSDEAESIKRASRKEMPCRVVAKARGVQWFVYNRSPAYDAILQRLKDEQVQNKRETPPVSHRDSFRQERTRVPKHNSTEEVRVEDQDDIGIDIRLGEKGFSSTNTDDSVEDSAQGNDVAHVSLPSILGILPIKVECTKGAVVMGNQSTRSILTATFESGSGFITARGTRPIDRYRQIIDFAFTHPIIQFKHNKEYKHSQVEEGKELSLNIDRAREEQPHRYQRLRFRHRIHEALDRLRCLVTNRKSSGSVESFSHHHLGLGGHPEVTANEANVYGPNRWLGLTRYLDDDDPTIEQERWKAVEYAQFPTILDSPSISMTFYWDAPGVVRPPVEGSRSVPPQYRSDINRDVPPDWGIDLRVGGGTINYGPWADRQRANLQAVLFPTLYMDALPGGVLSLGQSRVSTELKIMIDIEEQTTLRLPIREDSKDWKWKGHAAPPAKTKPKNKKGKSNVKGDKGQGTDNGPESRPFGWFDVELFPNSTVGVSMDLVAKGSGYKNSVNLDLKGIEVSSSVNHELLLKSQSQLISCDLGYPLEWNALRKWHIDIRDESMELFVLRDHIFLMTDLVNDWSSGPSADFYTFVPFEYTLDLHLSDFKMYVNANDSNIIDNPADAEDNTFIVIWGQELIADLAIPMEKFRPAKNKVSFNVEARDGGFELLTPPWNTQHTFLSSPHVAGLEDLRFNGSYSYYTGTSPALTDILLLDVHALSLKVELYGFLIRYLMRIKDNYFGDDIHFRTVQEYQELVAKGTDAPTKSEQRNRLSNDLDVILAITVTDSCAQLPSQLYSAAGGIALEIPLIEVDLRFTNYYMDLALTFNPIAVSQASFAGNLPLCDEKQSDTQIAIDGLEISGHRLFGLPPSEPTYVCNWDFDIGRIDGDCSISFLHNLVQALNCFGMTFTDAENALPPLNPSVIHDVTFLRANLKPVTIGVRIEQAALLLQTQEIKVDFNDWAGLRLSDRISLQVPDLSVSLVDTTGATSVDAVTSRLAKTHAYLTTSIDLHSVSRKPNFESDRQLQQDHIALHDMRTQRTPWLVLPCTHLHHAVPTPAAKIRPPAMCFPPIPAPGLANDASVSEASSWLTRSTLSAQSSHGPQRQSSFLTAMSGKMGSPRREEAASTGRSAVGKDSASSRSHSNISLAPTPRKYMDGSTTLREAQTKESIKPAAVSAQRGLSYLGFAFTSPYKRPPFPVLAILPDTQQIPQLPKNLAPDIVDDDIVPLDELTAGIQRDTSQSGLMVNFRQGVRLYCTPRALFLATKLQEGFEARTPEALLDSLQLNTMNQVKNTDVKRDKKSSIRSLRLHTPFIGLRFINQPVNKAGTQNRQERYELGLYNLTGTARSSDLVSYDAIEKASHQLSAHVTFDLLECSARELVEGHKSNQAVIELSFVQPVFWISKALMISANLQFDDLEIVSASRKVDHVSSLLRQTLVLVETLASRFSRIATSQASRLGLLVLLLTQASENIPDPPFLSGASSVLRSAVNHLRSSDSWKMMSKLRHVLQNMPSQLKVDIREKCAERFVSCPPEGTDYVIKSFDQWRTWDLAHVKSSILMQQAFGNLLLTPTQRISKAAPSKISLRAWRVRLLIDPGPNQNEVVVSKSVVNAALFQKGSLIGDPMEGDASSPSSSTVEAYFVQMALRLNWALCELVESIMRTIKDTALQHPQQVQNHIDERLTTTAEHRTDWHFVLCIETAILNVDTLALKIISLCQGLRSSLVLLAKNNTTKGGMTSMAISANAATSEVRSITKALTMYKLQRPSIVGSKGGSGEGGVEQPWRLVGSGKEVSFQVLASILDITEVADSFVKNELTLIHSWMVSSGYYSLPQRTSPDPPTTLPGIPKAQVTLVLDSYFVSVAILDTLSYQIHGTGGRTSLKSSMREDSRVYIDVDIRDHSHVFRGGLEPDAVELSSLHVPPISGRLSLDLTPQQKSVALRALAEPIIFDASAIHSMVTAINRPEIVGLGKRSGDAIVMIQDRALEIFGAGKREPTKAKTSTASLQPVLYDGYVTLAGFAIRARTPDSSSNDYAAELEFNMGRVQLKAANNEFGKLETFKQPEVEARLDAIRLKLMRSNERESITCGELAVAIMLRRTSKINAAAKLVPSYQIAVTNLEVYLYTETASVIVSIAGHLQDTLKTIEVSDEVKNLGKLGYARLRHESNVPTEAEAEQATRDPISEALLGAMYALELTNVCVTWKVGSSMPMTPTRNPVDLMLSLTKIDLATKRENTAQLSIHNLQLQMVSPATGATDRSANSALLPEVIFNAAYLSTPQDRRFAFQAKGKALDLRLTSQFILLTSDLRRSIAVATEQVRAATESWYASPAATNSGKRMNPLGSKRLGSVLVDADFAGAAVYIQGRSASNTQAAAMDVLRGGRLPQHGRYNQFNPEDANGSTTLRAPGFAFKAEYRNTDGAEPSLNAELKVDASSNMLYPTVVPLVMEISSSIKEIVGETDQPKEEPRTWRESRLAQSKFLEDDRLKNTDPAAIFGDLRLNFGLRICRQEFSLSCQPIARVAATACFDDIYITVNTVRSEQHGKFFSVSADITRLHASVQHVYSRESTAGFNVDSMVLSLMNSKHVSNTNGISAILSVSPTKLQINAKQSQDFLLFREIWVPREIRHSNSVSETTPTAEPQAFIVQRYQQAAAAGAFPWNATISIESLDVQLDLGQSLGKSAFTISRFWVSSRKSSDWEQNLCLGFDKAGVDGTGRVSGCVEMHDFKVRTSIQWPLVEDAHNQTPLVQASMGFERLQAKVGFDYQPFLIAHITGFEFLMYNVRDARRSARDRLVGTLDADQLQVYLTTTSAAQAIALYQAVQRLIQEKQTAYESSLRDIEKYLRRKSSVNSLAPQPVTEHRQVKSDLGSAATSLKLQTDVVVTFKTVNLGAFPSTFSDNQIFKLEALNASARFAVVLQQERIHSTLSMVLGQLRIALSGMDRTNVPKTLDDVLVKDVVVAAKESRDGTILKVPRLVATMQTWQNPHSTNIDYIFKSSFQGKVDVGWNYSRISYIRGMYNNHERALAQRLGKPLPQSAVQITGLESESGLPKTPGGEQEKITAVVNVPQSKYQYIALQPPVIETPQLRDMGEATPPLEWIGLQRDRLPNLTHQIVIVTLLQLAAEVDDAYTRILGSS